MKACGGTHVQSHIFLTSALVGGEWPASRPGRFTSGERAPGTRWIGGWVNLRAGLDDLEKRKFLALPGLDLITLCSPVKVNRRFGGAYQLHLQGGRMQQCCVLHAGFLLGLLFEPEDGGGMFLILLDCMVLCLRIQNSSSFFFFVESDIKVFFFCATSWVFGRVPSTLRSWKEIIIN
jgi:hypothetical protein